MIRYRLRCAETHEFEAWFGSMSAYESQAEAGQIACPVCGGGEVRKALMAPALGKGATSGPAAKEAIGLAAESSGADPARAAFIAEMRELRSTLTANAENVGDRFPEEARRIYLAETPQRSIYGKASPAEARALAEEGVPVMPLPVLPEDQN